MDGNRQVLRYHAKGTHKKDWLGTLSPERVCATRSELTSTGFPQSGIQAKNNTIDMPAIFVVDLNDDGKIVVSAISDTARNPPLKLSFVSVMAVANGNVHGWHGFNQSDVSLKPDRPSHAYRRIVEGLLHTYNCCELSGLKSLDLRIVRDVQQPVPK